MGDDEALLTRLYDAFNRKDIDAVLAFAHPDIVWHSLYDDAWLKGRSAVQDMWLRQFAAINPEITPLSFTRLDDGRLQVQVNYVIRTLDGRLFTDELATNTYRITDGQVIEMEWN